MTRRKVVVEADGGARGNPGPAGYGAVVADAETGEVLAERAESLGVATNNVAEYSGLIAGLAAAAELEATEVEVRMDSKLVIEQMSGRWQIKHPGLRPLAAQAAALARRFDKVTWGWIPRERNTRADALANAAMDAAMDKAVGGGRRPKVEPPRRSWEPPGGTPSRLILVRHGATSFTAERRYSGRGDVPLSELGHRQALAVAARLKAVPLVAVVSSPLSRCTATAAAIAAACGDSPVRTDPDLIECDFGAWEGRTFAEVRERWPAELAAWLDSPTVAPPDGESFGAVTFRVRRAVGKLRSAYPGQVVAVVSHVSPIKIMLRDALDGGDTFLHRLHLDPAGVSIVDSWPDGGVSVRLINETVPTG
jgi:probable phosphoglycerate mutase